MNNWVVLIYPQQIRDNENSNFVCEIFRYPAEFVRDSWKGLFIIAATASGVISRNVSKRTFRVMIPVNAIIAYKSRILTP